MANNNARIIFPDSVSGWKKLNDDIKTKHDADAASSVLNIFLQESAINLNADNSLLTDAVNHHNNFITASGKAEELRLTRDNLFTPVFSQLKKAVQYLKAFYKKNVRKLTDWGVQVDNENRIVYPAEFTLRNTLFIKFYAKHKSYVGITSPLHHYLLENVVNMDSLKTDADNSKTAHNNFLVQQKLSEEKSKERDNTMATPVSNTRSICGFLKKHFAKNPKKLGQYGIRVDDSPLGTIRRNTKINPSEEKLVNGALIGGFCTNTGITDLELRAGKKGDGPKTTIKAGKDLIITKGFSAFRVRNTSDTVAGSFSVDINK